MSESRKIKQVRRKAEAAELGLTMPEYAAMERQLKQANEVCAAEEYAREFEAECEWQAEQHEKLYKLEQKVRKHLSQARTAQGKRHWRARLRRVKALSRRI